MNYLTASRNQRARGSKVKQAVQFAVLLAACIWLLYQIKHSDEQRKGDDASIETKLSEKHGVMALGRTGKAGLSSRSYESDLDLVGEGEKKDGGAANNELDRNAREKAERASYRKDSDYDHGNVADNGEKGDEKGHERQHEEFQSNEDDNSDTKVGIINADHDKQEDERNPGNQTKKSSNAEEYRIVLIQDKGEAAKEIDEDKGLKNEETAAVETGGMFNVTFHSQIELEDGVHGFHDENGIPQDVNDTLESFPTRSSGHQESILHQEMASSVDNQSGIVESVPVGGQEVDTRVGISNTDAETDGRANLEGLKLDRTADAKIYSESFSSQQELEDVNISMLPQAE